MNIFDDLIKLARERKIKPVEGSYTNKLLNDKSLSKAKVLEEINELIEAIEKNSNQILDFTKEVKNMKEENKIKIIETLWKIIYSNNDADIYETNLMRRLTGLLYIDNKLMGDIKEKIKRKYLDDLPSK